MFRNQAQQEVQAYIALMAIACVLFLCWSQQSNWTLASCPLQSKHVQSKHVQSKHVQPQHVQSQLQTVDADSANTHVVSDCDISGQLLQQAHINILDGGAALTLFIILVLLVAAVHSPKPQSQAPPPRRRYRPHLVFCVFNE